MNSRYEGMDQTEAKIFVEDKEPSAELVSGETRGIIPTLGIKDKSPRANITTEIMP